MEFVLILGVVGMWTIILAIDVILQHHKAIGRAVVFTIVAQVIYFAMLFTAIALYPTVESFAAVAAVAALLMIFAFRYLVAMKINERISSLSLSLSY